MDAASELFARQDGLATISQLRVARVTRPEIDARLATGEWERFDRDVVGLAGVPVTWGRQARSALLTTNAATAALSHVTAARAHGFDGFAAESEIHVTIAGSGHHNVLAGFHVHRSQLLRTSECVTVDGMRVVGVPVALLQVAALRGRDATRKALDGVLRDGTSVERIRAGVERWRRRGVKGLPLLIQLLDETEQRLPRSFFQRLAKRVLAGMGVVLVDEHRVLDPDTGRTLAVLDLAAPDLLIGIECQSWHWHATPTARAADAHRKRRLQRLGWHIVELWWADLRRPDDVLADVRHAIAQRRS